MDITDGLKARFVAILTSYNSSLYRAEILWQELNAAYSSEARHYHTWLHIYRLCDLIDARPDEDDARRILLLAAYYHDAVYDVLKSDNEEQSSEMAAVRLREAGVTEADIQACCEYILATKSHTATGHESIDFFMDADLSVLGAAAEDYEQYALQIRREYSIYPDDIYRPGRSKVIRHFLSAPRIFKTKAFYNRLETAARANLAAEARHLE